MAGRCGEGVRKMCENWSEAVILVETRERSRRKLSFMKNQ